VTGSADLCNDGRLKWLGEEVDIRGKSVIELGPLEGAHSYVLEQMGAARVTAVEANSQAYLKCLITKELLRLQRVDFVLADFMEYLRQTDAVFDIAVACGVLYHMANPVELISLLAKRCRGHLLLWTHYFDGAVLGKDPAFKLRFTKETGATHEGFEHVLHRSNYVHADKWSGFCGGSAAYANWLSREDVLNCLTHFGFEGVKVRFDDPSHPNGPAFALMAKKKVMRSRFPESEKRLLFAYRRTLFLQAHIYHLRYFGAHLTTLNRDCPACLSVQEQGTWVTL
jgi:SAM-dependent methyltransferase